MVIISLKYVRVDKYIYVCIDVDAYRFFKIRRALRVRW